MVLHHFPTRFGTQDMPQFDHACDSLRHGPILGSSQNRSVKNGLRYGIAEAGTRIAVNEARKPECFGQISPLSTRAVRKQR